MPIVGGIVLAFVLAGGAYLGVARQAAPKVTFTSLTGEKINLQALRGKVVMVNFWATTCPFCVHEMPQMMETYRQFQPQGLQFVAVAMSYDRPDYVVNYATTRQLPFPVALDTQGELAHAFGDVNATPTTFLIDKSGRIIARYQGEPDFAALHRLLEQELAAAG